MKYHKYIIIYIIFILHNLQKKEYLFQETGRKDLVVR